MIHLSKKNILAVFFIAIFLFFCWGIYVPNSLSQKAMAVFVVQKGWGYKDISNNLARQGIIKNAGFFNAYALMFGSYKKLQAGKYELSSSMSVAQIIKKITTGDVIKNNITLIEGWTLQDVSGEFESKNIASKKDFLDLTKKDFSKEYAFLQDKPKNISLEGYIFPDTYQIAQGQTQEDVLKNILSHFDKKLTPDLRNEITKQKKTIFQIITMASMIEKEVITLEDKKIVSGILWKRVSGGMPLQIDSTINYITGKNDRGVSIKDTKIDSPYNTYKYYGLPQGPICNPGMDSILAAIYPEKSDYWYYLSVPKSYSAKASSEQAGQTIFSKTLEDHNAAVAKYLK